MENSLHQRVAICISLASVTFAAYGQVFRNGWVDLDDPAYITQNAHIQSGINWSTIRWAATTFYASNWHPLTWVSHAVDISLFQLSPAGHHGVNLFLHSLNAILLFVLLYMATRREWQSALVAALFALHPANVESVAWASERKNVLSMMFLLLAMICYTAYAKRRWMSAYLAAVACFALGLLAKPQIIALPFLLLLWDFWPLERWGTRRSDGNEDAASGARQWTRLLLEKIPLFLLSGLSAFLTMKAQSAGGAVQVADATRHAVAAFPLTIRIENSVLAYAQYMRDAIWPAHLAAMYPHPGRAIAFESVFLAGGVLIIISVMVFVSGRRRGYLVTGWLWFLGAMVPMIGIVQVGSQARADRYAYLPFIGLFLAVGWMAGDIAGRWVVARAVISTGAAVALAALSFATWRQVSFWRNPEVLWHHALETTKGNFFAHDSLAGYLIQRGRVDEACRHFDSSLQIFPGDIPAQEGLGVCSQARGDLPGAVRYYENVLRLSVDDTVRAAVFGNLGSIYRQLGNFAQAKENYEAALQLNPDLPIALVGTGLLAQKGWDFSKAAQQYERAMSVEPTSVGYLLLAKVLEQSGRSAEARNAYAQAQRLSTNIARDQKVAEELLAR